MHYLLTAGVLTLCANSFVLIKGGSVQKIMGKGTQFSNLTSIFKKTI